MEPVICNAKWVVLEPQWTRVKLSLDQKSVRDLDMQLMRGSEEVHVDSTDIGTSDDFLVWLKLGRAVKCCGVKWHLD